MYFYSEIPFYYIVAMFVQHAEYSDMVLSFFGFDGNCVVNAYICNSLAPAVKDYSTYIEYISMIILVAGKLSWRIWINRLSHNEVQRVYIFSGLYSVCQRTWLLSVRHQATVWTNVTYLPKGPLGNTSLIFNRNMASLSPEVSVANFVNGM